MIFEILGAFVNTLTVDDKVPPRNCGNLRLPIQMQLSKKQEIFFQIFVPFLESALNFKYFEKKGARHR